MDISYGMAVYVLFAYFIKLFFIYGKNDNMDFIPIKIL